MGLVQRPHDLIHLALLGVDLRQVEVVGEIGVTARTGVFEDCGRHVEVAIALCDLGDHVCKLRLAERDARDAVWSDAAEYDLGIRDAVDAFVGGCEADLCKSIAWHAPRQVVEDCHGVRTIADRQQQVSQFELQAVFERQPLPPRRE